MTSEKNISALKYDKGLDKLPWNLLPFKAVEGMLRVLHYGQRKYTVCLDCETDRAPTKVYQNPRLNGDPTRIECPNCQSKNIISGAHNWRKGFSWSRLVDSTFRHLVSFSTGNYTDEESGELHIHHAMCCVAFLSEHITDHLGTNDLFPYENRSYKTNL